MEDFLLLAQGEPAPGAELATEGAATNHNESITKQDSTNDNGTAKQPPRGGLFDSSFVWVMLLMFAVIYFVMMRPQKKKQQQHKDMLGNLKKNDRVRTIGGIIGTIVDVRDDEVVLKIDESTNTKIHLVRSAVSTVFSEEQGDQRR